MTSEASMKENEYIFLHMTTDIVSAYVSNNKINTDELPNLIKEVYGALCHVIGLSQDAGNEGLIPAVPIKKSITHDYIICLEDGKHLKMLKRYLRTHFQLSPAEYRAKWGLASDYPMVAPGYAQRRSDFAKKIGLGKTPNKTK